MVSRVVQLSFSLSACPSEAGTNFSLCSENLKCNWNLNEENNFITICTVTDRTALVQRDAFHGWCDTKKINNGNMFQNKSGPTSL